MKRALLRYHTHKLQKQRSKPQPNEEKVALHEMALSVLEGPVILPQLYKVIEFHNQKLLQGKKTNFHRSAYVYFVEMKGGKEEGVSVGGVSGDSGIGSQALHNELPLS